LRRMSLGDPDPPPLGEVARGTRDGGGLQQQSKSPLFVGTLVVSDVFRDVHLALGAPGGQPAEGPFSPEPLRTVGEQGRRWRFMTRMVAGTLGPKPQGWVDGTAPN